MDFDRLWTLAGTTQKELDRMSKGILALVDETDGGNKMKLAVVDLDGVICSNEARFAKAEEAKQAFLNDAQVRIGDSASAANVTKEATNIFWHTAFTPELVALDTLIPGVKDALNKLDWLSNTDWLDSDEDPYEIVFLTSRPESMRNATVEWLTQHDLYYNTVNGHRELVMKAPAFQYVKTVTWKAGMVQTLAALYGASEVLFVDDEIANTEMLIDTWNNDKVPLRCCSSLELAVSVDGRLPDEL